MNPDVNTFKQAKNTSEDLLYEEQENPQHWQKTSDRNQSPANETDIYRLLVENSSDGMALFENRKLVYASPSMNRIFGCEDFRNFSSYADVLQHVHPDDYGHIKKMYNDGIKNQLRHQTYTYRFRRQDGSYCWIENSVTRFYNDHGKNFRNIVLCRDVTNSKNIETELLQQKETFKTIADSTTAFIYIKDLEGAYIFTNRALEKVYNQPPGEMLGKKDSDITFDETAKAFRGNDLSVIESKKPAIFEETQELSDGLHTAVSVKVPLFDLDGKVMAICGITTDITDRKKAEQDVIGLKNKLELALTAGKMGIWEWHTEGNRVAWYGNQAQLFGIADHHFNGTVDDVRHLLHPDDRDKGLKVFKRAITQNKEYSYTYRVIWPDESVHWLHSFGTPVYDEEGKAIKVVGITYDITKQKLYRDKIVSQNRELNRINAMKDKLFSVISHDLVNPLNSLLGFIQVLQMNYRNETTENIGRYINLVSRSANSLSELLQSLSQWSKSQRRKVKVTTEEIDPACLVNEVAELLSANLNNKNLKLTNDLDSTHKAKGDKEMVKTILRNFLTNAIKFSHEEGNIHCSAKISNGKLVIKISDEGIGIKPEKLEHLFSVTANGSEDGTSGEKGTGLGLIICRELAELNHGKVFAESTRGKGSDFYLEIPANKAAWKNTDSND